MAVLLSLKDILVTAVEYSAMSCTSIDKVVVVMAVAQPKATSIPVVTHPESHVITSIPCSPVSARAALPFILSRSLFGDARQRQDRQKTQDSHAEDQSLCEHLDE